jgi:hypothetical protein
MHVAELLDANVPHENTAIGWVDDQYLSQLGDIAREALTVVILSFIIVRRWRWLLLLHQRLPV